MEKFFEMEIAGLKRKLPLCPVGGGVNIAAFIMFSDVEITIKTAEELLKKAPEFDVLMTAESKGLPLAYEMARQSGKNYVLARKSVKLYMTKPIEVEVKSITTEAKQKLYLDESDCVNLKGKKVLLVDDVISSGESMRALSELATKAGGEIAGMCAVLAEGDAAKREDIFFLEPLPLFFD